jgi:HSP20 family protein
MMRPSPFDEIERTFERMARQLDEMNGRFEGWSREGSAVGSGISVDVADHDDSVVVTADLPGFEKEDIDLSVSGRRLTIRAVRESTDETTDEAYVRRERRHESMRRAVPLPDDVDEEAAAARYTNGVLTVTLPKVTVDDDSSHIDIE